jgi:GNAT superfamily N-acetyltransferase
MALVATEGAAADERILGVVRYDRTGPEEAEAAFVVLDSWQGHGIATALLHRIAAYGRERGFKTFVAIMMESNTRMLDVVRHAGFPYTLRYQDGELGARMDISRPPEFQPR